MPALREPLKALLFEPELDALGRELDLDPAPEVVGRVPALGLEEAPAPAPLGLEDGLDGRVPAEGDPPVRPRAWLCETRFDPASPPNLLAVPESL